jgi:hypothetical protein
MIRNTICFVEALSVDGEINYQQEDVMRKNKNMQMKRLAAALSLSLMVTGACAVPAHANILDDAKKAISGAVGKAGEVLNDTGIAPAVKNAYNTVTDFIFTYETQPDDAQMESLARTWAVTAWLKDEEKEKSNTYYFDNHTYSMTENPTEIGSGYNLKKTPDGSSLNGKHTGILKAVVADATNYTVTWVNYEDEVNLYLLQKMKEKQGDTAETER